MKPEMGHAETPKPEDFESPKDYVLAVEPETTCFQANVAWPGQPTRRLWLLTLHPAQSISFARGENEDQAWERAAWRLRYEYMNKQFAALQQTNQRMKEKYDYALEVAAKDCLNSEGTYGEALKRMKLIEEWLVMAENEMQSRAALAEVGGETEI